MRASVTSLGPRKRDKLIAAWRQVRPRVVTANWRLDAEYAQGAAWKTTRSTVFLTTEFIDGELWLHMSFSHLDETPTWDELRDAKRIFMGANTKAVSVVPPSGEHYNLHPYCLHLFVCLERDPLPDFRDAKGRL